MVKLHQNRNVRLFLVVEQNLLKKRDQTSYYEAKCAKCRVVKKCDITLQNEPTHPLLQIETKIKIPPPLWVT